MDIWKTAWNLSLNKKNCFIWPDSKDRYVYTESEILCEVEPPSPCSNYRDEYRFLDELHDGMQYHNRKILRNLYITFALKSKTNFLRHDQLIMFVILLLIITKNLSLSVSTHIKRN